MRFSDHEQHPPRLPGERRPRRSGRGPASASDPPASNCRNSTRGFSAGEDRGHDRHEGAGRRPVQLHRERVADHRDPLRPGRARMPGQERRDLRLRQQLPRQDLVVADARGSSRPSSRSCAPAICHSAAVVPDRRDAQLVPSSARPTARNASSVPGRPSWPTDTGRPRPDVEGEQLLQAIAVALHLEHRLEEARDGRGPSPARGRPGSLRRRATA